VTQRIDLTGQTFGRLTALEYSHRAADGSRWRCRCVCGTEKTVRAACLRAPQDAAQGAPDDAGG
jgi:hypothetical protein